MAIGTGADGAQLLTLRLHPESLGAVQVRIEQAANGPAQVEITATRAETLALLRADSTAMTHALDQAGIPSENRSVTYLLAPPPADGFSQSGFSQSGLGQPMSGQQMPGQGFSPGSNGQQSAPDEAAGAHAGTALLAAASAPAGWTRAGLDITA